MECKIHYYATFELLTAVLLKFPVFRGGTLCPWARISRRLEGLYCLPSLLVSFVKRLETSFIINSTATFCLKILLGSCCKMFLDHIISEKYTQYDTYSYISFHIFPLYKYTLLPATLKLFETFQFCKILFSSFVHS